MINLGILLIYFVYIVIGFITSFLYHTFVSKALTARNLLIIGLLFPLTLPLLILGTVIIWLVYLPFLIRIKFKRLKYSSKQL